MAKYILTFKNPDYSTQDEAGDDVTKLPKAAAALKDKFIEWDEYVTIELDTETEMARVIPVGER